MNRNPYKKRGMERDFPQREKQPEEWEKILERETAKRDAHEILWDPQALIQFVENEKLNEMCEKMSDPVSSENVKYQIDLIKRIAHRKLNGITKKCLLIYMNSEMNFKQISNILGISDDTIRRHIQKAIEIIKACVKNKEGEFPKNPGKRPLLRASIFPLDTPDEQRSFQNFINLQNVLHVSYLADDIFREALVVYRKKKPGMKGKNTSPAQR